MKNSGFRDMNKCRSAPRSVPCPI